MLHMLLSALYAYLSNNDIPIQLLYPFKSLVQWNGCLLEIDIKNDPILATLEYYQMPIEYITPAQFPSWIIYECIIYPK
jgi:hypothetical protein